MSTRKRAAIPPTGGAMREEMPDIGEIEFDLLLESIGRQANMTATYYRTLRANEVPPSNAAMLTEAWMWICNTPDGVTEDDD